MIIKLYEFLRSLGLEFVVEELMGEMEGFKPVLIPDKKLAMIPISLERAEEEGESMSAILLDMRLRLADRGFDRIVFLYEDAWRSKGTLMRSRLAVLSGLGKNIYARNCVVKELDSVKAARFLNDNHFYGATKARYYLGLWRYRSTGVNETAMDDTADLVAVASFSALREMDGMYSSQWERYASARGCCVVGGMGKLLKAFEDKILSDNPDIERFGIMSYADLEWSEGNAYSKLGFEKKEYRKPVPFLVDAVTMERIHEEKFSKDRKYRNLPRNHYKRIYNAGSRRFFKIVSR